MYHSPLYYSHTPLPCGSRCHKTTHIGYSFHGMVRRAAAPRYGVSPLSYQVSEACSSFSSDKYDVPILTERSWPRCRSQLVHGRTIEGYGVVRLRPIAGMLGAHCVLGPGTRGARHVPPDKGAGHGASDAGTGESVSGQSVCVLQSTV